MRHSSAAIEGYRLGQGYRLGHRAKTGLAALMVSLALAGQAAGAAVNLRGASGADNGGGGTTLTLPVSAGVFEGDLLLAQVTVATGGASTSITAPPGWSQVLSTTSGSGAAQVIQRVYRHRVDAGEPSSYTWTFSGPRAASGGIAALFGANSSSPVAASNGAAGSCASSPCDVVSGTVSTGGPQNWVAGFYGIGAAASFAPPPALAGLYEAAAAGGPSSHGAAAEAGASSVGAQTAVAGGAGPWVAQLVAVRLDTGLPSASLANPGQYLRGAVTLAGSASDGGSGIASLAFEISPAGAGAWSQLGVVTAPPYSLAFDTTAVPDGLYDFRTVAMDWAGNVRASGARSNRWVDNTAPSAAFADPGVVLTGTVALSATAADGGSGMASVSFEYAPAGTGAWTPIRTDTTSPYTASFDTAALPDGLYDLRAVAADRASNVEIALHAARVVDNSPPSVTLADPGAALAGTVTLAASALDGASGIASVSIEVAPAGTGLWTPVATVPSPPYEAALDTTTLADGLYDLRAVAVDNAGHAASSAVLVRLVDNTAPTVTLADPGSFLRGLAPLGAAAVDLGSGVDAVIFEAAPAASGSWTAVGADPTAPYAIALDTAGLPDGSYELRAVAVDAAGNRGVSGVVAVVVDNAPPVTVDDAPAGWSRGAVTVSLSAWDAGSGVAWTEVSLDGGPFAAGSQVTVAAPADGSNDGVHTLRYRSGDRAGNVEADRTATVRIDTTPPAVTLESPSTLLAAASVSAAASDAGSGVASVAFERASAGGSDWQLVAVDREGPFEAQLGSLQPGRYDLRALAVDLAGNRAVSATVPVEVAGEPAPAAEPLRLRVLRAAAVKRRGRWFLEVRIHLSQPAALRAALRDPGGRRVRAWRLQGKEGTRTAMLPLPPRRPQGPRWTLVLRAAGAGAATVTRVPLRFA